MCRNDYHQVVFNHVPGTRTEHQHWALRYMRNICWDWDCWWMVVKRLCIRIMFLNSNMCVPASLNDVPNVAIPSVEEKIKLLLGSWFSTAFITLWIPLIWLWYVGQFPSSKSTWAKSPKRGFCSLRTQMPNISVRINVITNVLGKIITREWVYTFISEFNL